MTEEDFLKIVKDLRPLKPGEPVPTHAVVRHRAIADGQRVQILCGMCKLNIWEEVQHGMYRCWNCA